jgi:hypothetical protein
MSAEKEMSAEKDLFRLVAPPEDAQVEIDWVAFEGRLARLSTPERLQMARSANMVQDLLTASCIFSGPIHLSNHSCWNAPLQGRLRS